MFSVDIVFSILDDDSSGKLSFEETFIAIVDPRLFLKQENLVQAFKAFDLDGGGSVSVDEMQAFLSPNQVIPDYVWRNVLGLGPDDSIKIEVNIVDFRLFIQRLFEMRSM